MLKDQADQIAIAVGKTATYSGGASAFVFGLTANELAAFAGVFIALIGVCIQWFYGRRRDRRDAEYHAARLTWRSKDDDDES